MKVISFSRTVSLDILYGEGLKTTLILNGKNIFCRPPTLKLSRTSTLVTMITLENCPILPLS